MLSDRTPSWSIKACKDILLTYIWPCKVECWWLHIIIHGHPTWFPGYVGCRRIVYFAPVSSWHKDGWFWVLLERLVDLTRFKIRYYIDFRHWSLNSGSGNHISDYRYQRCVALLPAELSGTVHHHSTLHRCEVWWMWTNPYERICISSSRLQNVILFSLPCTNDNCTPNVDLVRACECQLYNHIWLLVAR